MEISFKTLNISLALNKVIMKFKNVPRGVLFALHILFCYQVGN